MRWEYTPPSQLALRWVESTVGSGTRVVEVARLRGGLTAAMDRLLVVTGSAEKQLVLRRWIVDDEDTAGIVGRESDALEAIAGSTVPAPRLVDRDDDGSQTGNRCTLTTTLRGAPELAPAALESWLHQLALTQANIHALAVEVPTHWPGWFDRDAPLDWIPDAALREEARTVAAGGRAGRDEVFAHGDYQHFNVLWEEGRLSGVVDWPNAAMSSRGGDVGHCRLNLAVLFSADVAERYLLDYESAAGTSVDPATDLQSVLSFDNHWQRFIPRQVDGRADLDIARMPERVTDLVRATLRRLG